MKAEKQERRRGKRIPGFRAIPWLVVIASALWGWSVLDTPVGPGEPVMGMVIAERLNGRNVRHMEIEMADGTRVDSAGSTPVGSLVPCLRFKKKYLPNPSYECR